MHRMMPAWFSRLLRLIVVFFFILSAAFPGGPRAQAQGLLPPNVTAMLDNNHIQGDYWALGAPVSILVDPADPALAEVSTSAYPQEEVLNPGKTIFDAVLPGGYDLVAGDLVTVSQETTTITFTVADFEVTGVDPVNDTVTVVYAAGLASLDVFANKVDAEWVHKTISADPLGGTFTADFAGTDGVDLIPGTKGFAKVFDPAGNATQREWNVWNPRFEAWPAYGSIHAVDFPRGEMLTVTVEHPAYENLPVDTQTVPVEDSPWSTGTWTLINAQLHAGDFITLSAGGTTLTHTVSALWIYYADLETSQAAGIAGLGEQVLVEGGMDCTRSVTAGALDGFWVADFSVAGPQGEPACPFIDPTTIDARVIDAGGQMTIMTTGATRSNVYVDLEQNSITTSNWRPDLPLALSIDRPGVGGTIDYSASIAPLHLVNNSFLLTGYEIETGDVVTLSDGTKTFTYVAAWIEVTGLDPLTDIVTGKGSPGDHIMVNFCRYGAAAVCATRYSFPDGNGDWSVNFSTTEAGGDQTIIDLVFGDSIQARAIDAGWQNATISKFYHFDAFFSARLSENQVHGYGFPLGETIPLEVRDGNGSLLYEESRPVVVAPWDSNSSFVLFEMAGHTLQTGDVISVGSGLNAKTTVVQPLAISGVDLLHEIVSGTALPGAVVEVRPVCGYDCGVRWATADTNGAWSADFSIPGEPPAMLQTFDFIEGSEVTAEIVDQDSDRTFTSTRLPRPNAQVFLDTNQVNGYGWPLGTPVTLEVFGQDGDPEAEYTATVEPGPAPWNPDNDTLVSFWLGSANVIQPGDLVRMTNGQFTRELSVVSLLVSSINPATDVVTGSASPGSLVEVRPFCNGDCGYRLVAAEGSGAWTVDFSQPALEGQGQGGPFDFGPGSGVNTAIRDAEDDITSFNFWLHNPSFSARLDENQVHGYNWRWGDPITLTINGHGETFSQTLYADWAPWDSNQVALLFDLGDFTLTRGDVIEMTDGVLTRTTVVADLWVSEVNPANDTVSGTAPAGANIQVGHICDENGCAFRETNADENGNWMVDFSQPGDNPENELDLFDIRPGSGNEARLIDPDGDTTNVQWWVPNPRIVAFPGWDNVGGDEWPTDRPTTLVINGNPDLTFIATAYPRPWDPNSTWIEFNDLGGYDLKAGDVLTMSDGFSMKTLTVSGLSTGEVTADLDTVSGIANFERAVQVWIDNTPQWVNRNLTSGADGSWLADFATPGSNGDEQETYDIRPGSSGQVKEYDEDGDSTQIQWRLANPTFSVRLGENEVHAYEWPLGTPVTLAVDDPSTGAGVDFETTLDPQVDPWNPNTTLTRFANLGVLLTPGDSVTLSNGAFTKTTVVQDLVVTQVDPAAETVAGNGPSGAVVEVGWICNETGCTVRRASVVDGQWAVDFSIAGEENDEQMLADIRPGDYNEAAIYDEDGDRTSRPWYVPNPHLVAFPDRDFVGGDEWPLDQDTTVIIDDGSTPEVEALSFSGRAYPAPWNPANTWIDIQLGGYDLKMGDHLTMRSGTLEKSVTVSGLHITGIDADQDTVSGQTWAGLWTQVWLDTAPEWTSRMVEPAADGTWQVSFAVPGASGDGDGTYDLKPGDAGQAKDYDEDGDSTSINWSIAEPGAPFCPAGTSISGRTALEGAWYGGTFADPTDPISVYIEDFDTSEILFQAGIDQDGNYGCSLPAGTYRVYAQHTAYATVFYGGPVRSESQPLVVTEGGSIPGIDLIFTTPTFAYENLTFNFADGRLTAIPAVRQAIAWAVNREHIIAYQAQYSPLLKALSIPGGPEYPAFGLPEHHYNPDQARAILDAAGIVDTDSDGVREAGGQPLSLTLITTNRPERIWQANLIQANLAAVGIQLNVVIENIFGEDGKLVQGDFDIAMFTWIIDPGLENGLGILYSPTGEAQNFGQYDNPDAFDLLDQAAAEEDYAARMPYYQQYQVLMMADLPVLPLYWRVEVDTDLDGTPDLADACPGDPTNTCAPETTGAAVIDETGGTVTAENSEVEIVIPAEALAETTSITITEMGGNFAVAAYDGEMLAANSYSIEPHGTTFDQPVTITFTWPDGDNDGFVDGTSLYEANLQVIKNNMIISPVCSENPACDMAANTVSVEVTSLSLFILAGPENQAPVAVISGSEAGVEGEPFTFDASQSIDPEGGALAFAWDTDADGQFDDGEGPTLALTFADEGSYSVAVRVVDARGLASTASLSVTAANAAPIVGVIIAPLDPSPVSTLISVAASISDPGASDILSATWDWGDGMESAAVISGGMVSGSHAYLNPGVYSLVLSVTDQDGGESTRIFNYVVVYDPNGGFVTGGGWVYSPRGAYLANPDASGKTSFGFVAKYKKDASLPSGNTEFMFQVGGFNFNASAYNWLVVNNQTAQFLGSGTLNNSGSYRFTITVFDGKTTGTPDCFRIQIWDNATGGLIYDNQPGSLLNDPATTPIGGGSIVVHK